MEVKGLACLYRYFNPCVHHIYISTTDDSAEDVSNKQFPIRHLIQYDPSVPFFAASDSAWQTLTCLSPPIPSSDDINLDMSLDHGLPTQHRADAYGEKMSPDS